MPGNQAFVPVEVGFIVDVTIADPGAGNEFIYTFPDGYLYKFELISYLYSCDANASDRLLFLCLQDSGAVVFAEWSNYQALSASQQLLLTQAKNLNYITVRSSRCVLKCPDCWIPGGWQLFSRTENMQVGDTYTVIRLLLRSYREQN